MKRFTLWKNKKIIWNALYLDVLIRDSKIFQWCPIWYRSGYTYNSIYFGFGYFCIHIEYFHK